MIDFVMLVVAKFSTADTYTYLKQALCPYLKYSFPIITSDIFIKTLKAPLSRFVYEMGKRSYDVYTFDLQASDILAANLVLPFIECCKEKQNNMTDNNITRFNIANIDNRMLFDDMTLKLKVSVEPVSLASKIKRSFYKFIQKYPPDDILRQTNLSF